jgi:hypothetical protein
MIVLCTKKDVSFETYPVSYHTVVLLESPAIMSKIRLMPGMFNMVPNTGTRRRKFIATGRKPLKKEFNRR